MVPTFAERPVTTPTELDTRVKYVSWLISRQSFGSRMRTLTSGV